MENFSEIEECFKNLIKDIDNILADDFYSKENDLLQIKEMVKKWYRAFNKQKTLVTIDPTELKNADLEITTVFADYIAIESIEKNYVELLMHDFDHLEKIWKKEMMGVNKNGI